MLGDYVSILSSRDLPGNQIHAAMEFGDQLRAGHKEAGLSDDNRQCDASDSAGTSMEMSDDKGAPLSALQQGCPNSNWEESIISTSTAT